jgi:hypothetical protein
MPRHTTKPVKVTGRETVSEMWEAAMGVAEDTAAEAAERYSLPYKAAFTLLRYMERYAWNCVMSMPWSKGWWTRLYHAVAAEAERIAFKMARAMRTVDEEERRRIYTELETELRRP